MALVLTSHNKGYWVLRSTIKGRRRDIGLGSLSLVTLKEAREHAFEMRRDIQRGIDPIAERRKQEVVVPTFANAARTVHAEQRASWKNGKFAYSGPDVGFVVQVTPIDFTPKPFPDLNTASETDLHDYLLSPRGSISVM